MITINVAELMLGLVQICAVLLFIVGVFAAGFYFGYRDGINGL